jgi:hypothetical protein
MHPGTLKAITSEKETEKRGMKECEKSKTQTERKSEGKKKRKRG